MNLSVVSVIGFEDRKANHYSIAPIILIIIIIIIFPFPIIISVCI